RCGYGDAFAFSKAFRRHHGCSPSAWRRRLQDGRHRERGDG
ncbi:MAG: helix-turn-helix domain-containing protein, partial [Planctomycetota bacterium]